MSDRQSGQPPLRARRRRTTAKEHGPDPIDVHVGTQLRIARELAGLTQTEVGSRLGMSFQVIQKYEQGEIRVSASRLFRLATLLARPPDYFFEGLTAAEPSGIGTLTRAEVEMVRAFRAVGSPELQQLLVRFVTDIVEKHGAALRKADK